MENDETHIIHRILKGETSLYEYFLDKYSQQVFILIIRIVENQEDAEELTQDTFLKAFEHLSSFKAESSFSTWIYRIAYNTAISATRKRKQELIVMDSAMLMNISDQQIDDALNDESGERVGKLNKAIKKLDAEERALISLFYNEEKTIGEIALILGLTESNAKVKLHTNKKKIIYTHNRSRMNEKQKDKGLMKAVKEQPQFRLTSNFTFRTMQKVEEAILLREKKQERKMLLATIAASLFLIISSSIGLYIYFGKHLKATMYHAFSHVLKIQIPLIYLLFIITIPLFIIFDRWMRKQYFKHHS